MQAKAVWAVADWLIRHVAGIRAAAPGYREVVVDPDLGAPFKVKRASIATPFGKVGLE